MYRGIKIVARNFGVGVLAGTALLAISLALLSLIVVVVGGLFFLLTWADSHGMVWPTVLVLILTGFGILSVVHSWWVTDSDTPRVEESDD